jgi:hypothetical protein
MKSTAQQGTNEGNKMETKVKSAGFTAIAVDQIPKGNTRLGKIYRRFTDSEICTPQMVEFRKEGYEWGVSAVRVTFSSTVIRPNAETWLTLQGNPPALTNHRTRDYSVAIPSLIFVDEDGDILWAYYCLMTAGKDGVVTEEVRTGDEHRVRSAPEIERWTNKGYYDTLIYEIGSFRRSEQEAQERQRRIAEAQLTPVPYETQRVIDRVQRWLDDHAQKSSPKTEANAFDVFSVSDAMNYTVSLIVKSLCKSFLQYAGRVRAEANIYPIFQVEGTFYERLTVAEAYAEVVKGYIANTYNERLALSGEVLKMFNDVIGH